MLHGARPPLALPVSPLTGELDPTSSPLGDDRLATLISRLIARRTDGKIQDLRVLVRGDEIWLCGRCTSFYGKQLAQHAAMEVAMGATLHNEIVVD